MQLPVKDYYTILGLAPQATTADIRKAYRLLARKYHPDTNPDDQYALAQFAAVKEAYEVLTHPEKKRLYIEERWLTRFHAGTYDNTGPVTPETVLKRVLQYEKYLFSQDIYRMNKGAAAAELEALCSADTVAQLLHFNDGAVNAEIVRSALRMSGCLSYADTAGLAAQLERLAGDNMSLQKAIAHARRRQLLQYRWNRYYWVAAVLTAVLLMGLLLLLTSKG